MKIKYYSTITCPICGHKKEEKCRLMPASTSMNVKNVILYSSQSRGSVVYFVPMVLSNVPLNS